jgi:hypothetical protein
VVTNVVSTLQPALGGTLAERASNAAVAAGCVVLFLACLAWLRRATPPPTAV